MNFNFVFFILYFSFFDVALNQLNLLQSCLWRLYRGAWKAAIFASVWMHEA